MGHHKLGVPLKQEKPSTKMTFLGINLDAETQIASIPQDKLDALANLAPFTPEVLSRQGTLVPYLICYEGYSSWENLRLLDTAHSITDSVTPLTFASTWRPSFSNLLGHTPQTCASTPMPLPRLDMGPFGKAIGYKQDGSNHTAFSAVRHSDGM